MDPFIVGSLISGASSLLGGALDRKDQKHAAGREMEDKILMGRKYGLHPLASIGAQTSGYAPVMSGAFESAGNAIQTGLAQRANARSASGLERKQEQLMDAQILEATSRTRLNEANAKRALVGTGLPEDPFARRKENALVEVMLENGDVVLVPNPDVYEISPTELAAGRLMLEGGRVVSQVSGPPTRSRRSPPAEYSTDWRDYLGRIGG